MDSKRAYSCPFCNGRSLKVDQKKDSNFRYTNAEREDCYVVTVRCNKCHARGPTTSVWLKWPQGANAVDVLRESALRVWNKQAQVNDCRNELCLLCGNYKNAHLGSCDGCRWYEMESGEVS